MTARSLLPLFVGLLTPTGLTAQTDLPVYVVKKVTTPIKVDGHLDDPPWEHIPVIGPFHDNLTGAEGSPKTLARVAYDDEYLYFGFESWDENIWATFRERNQHLWLEEVVEVFLQPDPNHPNYIELEVNPLGTLLDIYLLDIRKPLRYESWNSSEIQWAVQVDGKVNGQPGDRKWTCEIAFPLADAVTAPNLPPEPGDRWRMNLYRIERIPEPASLAWSPTLKRDFHVPDRFGYIEFSAESVP